MYTLLLLHTTHRPEMPWQCTGGELASLQLPVHAPDFGPYGDLNQRPSGSQPNSLRTEILPPQFQKGFFGNFKSYP